MSNPTVTPEVLWAQRSSSSDPTKNHIFLTIAAPDVPAADMKLEITPTGLTFTGPSQTKKVTYHVALEFYAEIDDKETKIHHSARDVELVLRKKELKEEFWPRLLKESKRMHFLKTDFDKWVDEDEQDEVQDDDYLSKMGGMGDMAGMGGMGGMGGDGGFGGIDFSKLGGDMGGMDLSALQGMGGMDMSGAGGDDEGDDGEGDDDDDMPALEGEAAAPATKAGSKIEEVE